VRGVAAFLQRDTRPPGGRTRHPLLPRLR
jgi:hypothetical protein